MAKFLHLADLHLGATFDRLGNNGLKRAADFHDAFKRAVDHAVAPENEIAAVLLVGDIFDSHRPPDDAVELFISQTKRLHDAGITALLVPGNHDGYEYPDSIYRKNMKTVHLFSEPMVGNPVILSLGGTDFHFYGFAYDSQLSTPPFDSFKGSGEEGVHVALIHGALQQGNQFSVHKRHVPVDAANLAVTGMDYIALGHYHNYYETDTGGVKMVYPGTLEGKRVTETGERFLVEVDLAPGKVKVNKIPFNRRTLTSETLDLSGEGRPAEAFRSYLSEHSDPDLLLNLTITGSVSDNIPIEEITSAYADGYFHLQISDNLSCFGAEFVKSVAEERTVRGAFVRKLLDGIETLEDEQRKIRDMALRAGLRYMRQVEE